jgi:hypothetical protein
MVIAYPSGMSYSIAATILKNKNKVVKGIASLKGLRLTKTTKGFASDMEKLLVPELKTRHKSIPFLKP